MYDFSVLLQFFISGITVGCVYGLVGIGFAVIYTSTGVANFAQGAFVMLGGMIAYVLYSIVGWPYVPALLAAIAIVSLVGLGMECVVIRPLRQRNAPAFSLILATVAVQVIIANVTMLTVDDKPHVLPMFTDGSPIKVFGAAVSLQALWIVGGSLMLVYLLSEFYRRTMIGKAMRACAINSEVAKILGIRVERMMALAFTLSAAIGAIGGILVTPLQYTAFFVGISYAVSGFIAAIIGGVGNLLGAFVGGVIIGLLQSLSIIFLDSGYKSAVAFTVLLILLVLRPNGLFASRATD
jgi:branched-chain amino acid transport system permease protein